MKIDRLIANFFTNKSYNRGDKGRSFVGNFKFLGIYEKTFIGSAYDGRFGPSGMFLQ